MVLTLKQYLQSIESNNRHCLQVLHLYFNLETKKGLINILQTNRFNELIQLIQEGCNICLFSKSVFTHTDLLTLITLQLWPL